jgi:hypothetical protein
MTLKEVMEVCPNLSEEQAKDVLETASKEANPVTYEDIGRVAEQLYH